MNFLLYRVSVWKLTQMEIYRWKFLTRLICHTTTDQIVVLNQLSAFFLKIPPHASIQYACPIMQWVDRVRARLRAASRRRTSPNRQSHNQTFTAKMSQLALVGRRPRQSQPPPRAGNGVLVCRGWEEEAGVCGAARGAMQCCFC